MSRDIDPAVLPTLAVGYGRGKCSHPAGVCCELTDGTVPGEGHKHSGHWLEREACARAAGARALRIIKNPYGRAPPPVEMMGVGTPKCWLLLRDNHGYIYRPPHVFSTWQELAEHLEAQKKSGPVTGLPAIFEGVHSSREMIAWAAGAQAFFPKQDQGQTSSATEAGNMLLPNAAAAAAKAADAACAGSCAVSHSKLAAPHAKSTSAAAPSQCAALIAPIQGGASSSAAAAGSITAPVPPPFTTDMCLQKPHIQQMWEELFGLHVSKSTESLQAADAVFAQAVHLSECLHMEVDAWQEVSHRSGFLSVPEARHPCIDLNAVRKKLDQLGRQVKEYQASLRDAEQPLV